MERAKEEGFCGITSQKIRQMTSKYRQFASLIVLRGSLITPCGPNVRGISSQKIRQKRAKCRQFASPAVVGSQFPEKYVKLTLKFHQFAAI